MLTWFIICFFSYFTNCFTIKEINVTQMQIVHFLFLYIYLLKLRYQKSGIIRKIRRLKAKIRLCIRTVFTTVIPVRILKICTTEAKTQQSAKICMLICFRSCMPSISNFLKFFFRMQSNIQDCHLETSEVQQFYSAHKSYLCYRQSRCCAKRLTTETSKFGQQYTNDGRWYYCKWPSTGRYLSIVSVCNHFSMYCF